jgi:hypothetical protein
MIREDLEDTLGPLTLFEITGETPPPDPPGRVPPSAKEPTMSDTEELSAPERLQAGPDAPSDGTEPDDSEDGLDPALLFPPLSHTGSDEKTLQDLSAFQDRVRESLTATATQPTVLSAPSPPNQAAAPDQAPSGSFTRQTASALTQPAARHHKPEPDVTLRLTRPQAHAATPPDAGPVANVRIAPSSPVPSEVTAPPSPHAAGQAVAVAVVPRFATELRGGASPRQLATGRASRESGPEVALARRSDVGPVENPSQPDAVQMPAPKAPNAAPTSPAVAQLVSADRALQDNDVEGAKGPETIPAFVGPVNTRNGATIQ